MFDLKLSFLAGVLGGLSCCICSQIKNKGDFCKTYIPSCDCPGAEPSDDKDKGSDVINEKPDIEENDINTEPVVDGLGS